ncbi:MAG: thiamine diphosphokinase [Rhodobacteraceae bacterium]|nr:thiamine diphosphokinase [Paracoccaceae bacterium]
MSRTLSFFEPVIVIGGGPVSPDDVALVQRFSNKTIAADSGVDAADALGLDVFAVLGDMDSVSQAGARKNIGKSTRISEQDTTDFEKCIYSSDAPLYLCIGVLGGRIDHQLAALNVLAKYPDRKIILIGPQDITLLCPLDFSVELPIGTRLSLFPLGAVFGVHSDGLEWKMNGVDMDSSGKIGTSNRTSAARVHIRYGQGALLLVLPVETLPELLKSL